MKDIRVLTMVMLRKPSGRALRSRPLKMDDLEETMKSKKIIGWRQIVEEWKKIVEKIKLILTGNTVNQ